jgi:hypothetical protein
MQRRNKSKFVQRTWKVMVIFISISMVLALILPFVDLGL